MILAILQARTSSTRLPGKVLMPILGKPMLLLQLERLQRSRAIDRLMVATTSEPGDDAVESLCREAGIPCFRGSLDDVLDRFYQAARGTGAEHIVRLTGDCPLADPAVIDGIVREHLAAGNDYTSNVLPPTFPDGLDAEVFRYRCLEEAWREAALPSQREHVTPFINRQPSRYRIGNVKAPEDLSRLRWTVDEAADFGFVKAVYEALYPAKPDFATDDVLAFLRSRPDVAGVNSGFLRNEGYVKSMIQDREHSMKTLDQSLAMQERAKRRIPGMTQLLSKRPDLFSQGVWPGYFSKAKGAEVWDLDGNRYVDMSIGGIGANVLGYADEEVNAAVVRAVADGNSSSLNCPEEVELAELLCEIHPWAEKVRYARTGGESMAVAVRIARAHTGREKVAFCGYHGWHDWYLSANLGTENALGEHLIPGLVPNGVPKALTGTAFPFKYNQLQQLESLVSTHGKELAAIIIEPIRNEEPQPGFLEGVQQLARETQAVFIMDEISSGFRLNSGGAHLLFGVLPDIAVFSKALGNGYPIAAIIGKGSVMDAAQKSFISSTYWTERLGPAAAIATLQKHRREKAADHLVAIGRRIQEGWRQLARTHGLAIHVGGIPPLGHFTFDGEDAPVLKALFIQLMLEKGFLASSSFYSMFAHTEAHAAAYLEAADGAFRLIAEAKSAGIAGKLLRGQPSVSGFRRLN